MVPGLEIQLDRAVVLVAEGRIDLILRHQAQHGQHRVVLHVALQRTGCHRHEEPQRGVVLGRVDLVEHRVTDLTEGLVAVEATTEQLPHEQGSELGDCLAIHFVRHVHPLLGCSSASLW